MDGSKKIEGRTGKRGQKFQAGMVALLMAAIPLLLLGCGAATHPGFQLEVAPTALSVVPGGAAETLTIGILPERGFSGKVSLTVGNLPAGITASPATFSLSGGELQQVKIAAEPTTTPGAVPILVAGESGELSRTTAAVATIQTAPPLPATSATLSNSTFSFGNNLVGNAMTQTVAVVTNTGGDALAMNPALTGDSSYSIVGASSCGATLAPAASCAMVVSYDPTVASAPGAQTATLNMGFGNVSAATPQTVSLTGISAALTPGVVTATDNPQVALYTMTLPFPGSVVVNFGPTTEYGLSTWTRSTARSAGQVRIFVAGMRASTQYHMAASVQFTNGLTATDQDHTFTTGALPAGANLNLTVTTAAGGAPSPGLEMVNTLASLVVTDLTGNELWAYVDPQSSISGHSIDGVKMLPNGDIVMVIAPGSPSPLSGPQPPNALAEIREVNLAGDTVREISVADLNAELQTATCAECNVTLGTFHHDVTPLPNGHWLVLSNATMNLSPTSTPPLTNAAPQAVLGDVIVDLDQNLKPVWVWNEFNHLDPNRHPMSVSDWTHSNAIVYSPDDGNILISIRHQNWVVKVDYANGSGTGNILWKLGLEGDFTLLGGTDPTDWQYAQHAPSLFSQNSTGVFQLGLMDNGDDRVFPGGATCGIGGAPACYSTIPVFQIDENAKTATLVFHQTGSPAEYSMWGGNAEKLANGDIEYDLTGVGIVRETTMDASPQTVWTMIVPSETAYRAFRIPSLYPGVQW